MTERPGRGQHEVGGGARRVGRAADGDADVGLFQRRRIVDAVAGHADDVAGALEDLDDLELVLGEDAGEAVRGDDARGVRIGASFGEGVRRHHYLSAEAQFSGGLRGDRLVVAGHHLDVDAHRARRGDRLGAVVARGVEERQEAEKPPVSWRFSASDAESAIALGGVRLDQRLDRLSLGGVGLAQVEDHLRRALGDGEAGALRLDVRLRAFRHRIERPERAHGVGLELQPGRFGAEDRGVDGVGRIAAR